MSTESGDVTPKTPEVKVTPEMFQQLKDNYEATQQEFLDFRTKHKTIIDEIKDNSKGRFFKEGATKVENELREALKIEGDLTGKELIELISTKVQSKKDVPPVNDEIAKQTAAKFKALEDALTAEKNKFAQYQSEIDRTSKLGKLESFASTVLSTGDYKLSEDANVNAKRLNAAITLNSDLKVDYSGTEPVILGDDGLPLYNTNGSKVTLNDKIQESLGIYFDKKPIADPKLKLLDGQGKKIEISSSIADIDAKLNKATTSEEYAALLEAKTKLLTSN